MSATIARAPRSYPGQVGLTCGEANARSVIDSFGVAYQTPSRTRIWVKLFGHSLLTDLRLLMEAHGLAAPVRHAGRLNRDLKVRVPKSHVDAGNPVVVAIGNGHLRRGRYVWWARLLLGHYLTVYGYDDARRVFYVYDSYLRGRPPAPLPAGNETRSYAEMLRDWKGPIYYRLIGRNHAYLPVSRRGDAARPDRRAAAKAPSDP